MEFHIWLRYSRFNEHLAIGNRIGWRKSDDSRESIEVRKKMIFERSPVLMLSISFDSGNVIIETKFFDGNLEISTSRVRILYI